MNKEVYGCSMTIKDKLLYGTPIQYAISILFHLISNLKDALNLRNSIEFSGHRIYD